MKTLVAITAAVALAGQAAHANEIFASQPKTVVTAIQELGYRAAVVSETDGKRIDSAVGGLNYSIRFYGCDDAGAGCQFLEFTTSFTVEPAVAPEAIAQWNRDNLFGTAFVDDTGLPNVSYTVTTVGGLTAENFADVLARWEVTLDSFANAIGY
jgi:hypothetical protein